MSKNRDVPSTDDKAGSEGMSREHFLRSADVLRVEMERQSLDIRDLILAQPPVQLLGYLWAQFHLKVLADLRQQEENYRPDKKLIETFQFSLEYLHAIWASHAELPSETTPLEEATANALLETLQELKDATMMYAMASSAASIEPGGSRQSAETEFHAKSAWVLIRGNRYQVLEEEFFRFVLAP